MCASFDIEYLEWDSHFFSCNIALLKQPLVTEADVLRTENWCKEHSINCLYYLASLDNNYNIHLAEENGFRLVDVRQTLQCKLNHFEATQSPDCDDELKVFIAQKSEYAVLYKTTSTMYRGMTRFYRDPRFDQSQCDELYRVWMERSLSDENDTVFVCMFHDELAGFVTCRQTISKCFKIGLVGVEEAFRGKTIAAQLIKQCMEHVKDLGGESITVVTQGSNIPAIRLYEKNQFYTSKQELWFHKWFTREHKKSK